VEVVWVSLAGGGRDARVGSIIVSGSSAGFTYLVFVCRGRRGGAGESDEALSASERVDGGSTGFGGLFPISVEGVDSVMSSQFQSARNGIPRYNLICRVSRIAWGLGINVYQVQILTKESKLVVHKLGMRSYLFGIFNRQRKAEIFGYFRR